MSDTPPPHPVARTSPTPLPAHRDTRAMVRRARLEHLATELLRLGGALRPPVPIESLYANPPHLLWQPDPDLLLQAADTDRTLDDLYQPRLELARAIAEHISLSGWSLRVQLLGSQPLTAGEIALFALALLLPTGLLSGISERQRTPPAISTIFQAPLKETMLRLAELGYLTPESDQPVVSDTTD